MPGSQGIKPTIRLHGDRSCAGSSWYGWPSARLRYACWALERCIRHSRSPTLHDLACRVSAGDAHDAASGVGCGAAQVEIADRRAVVGKADHRAQEEELIEVHGPLKDVA